MVNLRVPSIVLDAVKGRPEGNGAKQREATLKIRNYDDQWHVQGALEQLKSTIS